MSDSKAHTIQKNVFVKPNALPLEEKSKNDQDIIDLTDTDDRVVTSEIVISPSSVSKGR